MTKIKKETPNTKKSLTSGVLNAKIFGLSEQYNLKFGSIRIGIVKFLWFFFSHFSLISHFSVKSLPLFFSKDDPLLSQPLIFSSLILTAFPLFLSASLCHRSFSWSGFFFFFFVIWYVGSVIGGFRWWCVGLDGVGWVWLWQWWVG